MSSRTSTENFATVVTGPSSALSQTPNKGIFDFWVIAVLLTIAGTAALWFFYSRNEILLSGDAVAHINIARRVFDSRTPGLLQLGSVWLPLPHLLTIPFVVNMRLWQTGIGGSVVSVVSYVLAGLGLFRLMLRWSRLTAWLATIFFAADPNLLYVQTTALNEPLYLATFIWSAVFFVDAYTSFKTGQTGAGKSLEKGAIALTAAIFTRYDGWFLAAMCWLTILPSGLRAIRSLPRVDALRLRKSLSKALILTALGPTVWLAYNFGVYGNPLAFANGPYSAKAIAQRTTPKDAPPYPGERHAWTAGVYFTKAAQLNIGEGRIGWLLVAIAALVSLGMLRKNAVLIVLLWSPILFYALSIAYGAVPIFIPTWWPFSYYNLRYGLELVPAIVAGLALLGVVRTDSQPRWARSACVMLGVILVFTSYVNVWRAVPICLREVRVNGQARMELDRRLAGALATLPRSTKILAYTGAHSGAFELAAFPLRQTINEGNYLVWDSALLSPALASDYVIASDGDPVAEAAAKRPAELEPTMKIEAQGQPTIVVYRSKLRSP